MLGQGGVEGEGLGVERWVGGWVGGQEEDDFGPFERGREGGGGGGGGEDGRGPRIKALGEGGWEKTSFSSELELKKEEAEEVGGEVDGGLLDPLAFAGVEEEGGDPLLSLDEALGDECAD